MSRSWNRLQVVFLALTVLSLSVLGMPPLAGFWSKDEILAYAWDRSPALWLVGLAATLAVGLAIALQPTARTHLQLVVLDAGHGGAILLECLNGKTLLEKKTTTLI